MRAVYFRAPSRAYYAPMFRAFLFFLIEKAYAQPSSMNPNTSACNDIFSDGGYSAGQAGASSAAATGSGYLCIAQYIQHATEVVVAFAASISLIMLIINGFRYMVGPAIPGGSSDAAKKGIGSALAGLALSLLTYIIIDTIVVALT